MKNSQPLLSLLLGGFFACAVHAATIVSVTGPASSAPGLQSTQVDGVSFSLSQQFTNVTISVELLAIGAPLTGTAYLTDAIGSTATSANQIASASFDFPDGTNLGCFTDSPPCQMLDLFTGLTLPADTYYLTLVGPDLGPNGSFCCGWFATDSPTLVTASGVAIGSFFTTSSPASYAPASTFDSAPVFVYR